MPTQKRNLVLSHKVFLFCNDVCLAANDVTNANDVAFGNDVCLRAHETLRQTLHHIGYNTSLGVAPHHFECQRDTSFTNYKFCVKLNLKGVNIYE